jgi:hypothetical protein
LHELGSGLAIFHSMELAKVSLGERNIFKPGCIFIERIYGTILYEQNKKHNKGDQENSENIIFVKMKNIN